MNALMPFHRPAHLAWTYGGEKHQFVFDNVISEEWKNDATITEHPVEQGANVADHVRVEVPEVTLTIHATNEPLGSNQYMQATFAPQSVTIPMPTWTPGSGVVVVPTWENLIAVRAATANVVGLAGGNGVAAGAVGALALAGAVGGVFGAALPIFDGIEVDEPVQLAQAGLQPPHATGTVTARSGGASPTFQKTITTDSKSQSWPGGFDFVEQQISQLLLLKDRAQLMTVFGSKQFEQNMVIQSLSYSRNSGEGTGAVITLGLKQVRIVATQVVASPIPDLPRAQPPTNKGAQNPTDAPPAMQESVLRGIAPIVLGSR
ncbi:MAG TPA: hypothetical protein VK841_23335 [Polyangiaceae bacterium]|jgi:hypothetical protein|nr:hypothetical protein [Polyangiaceae bacterium]